MPTFAVIMVAKTDISNFGFGNGHHAATGYLNSRTGMIADTESFEYDDLDRLKLVKHNNTNAMVIGYQTNGNIESKTNVGTKYNYQTTRKHAIDDIENPGSLLTTLIQDIKYTAFNKTNELSATRNGYSYKLDVTYGPDQQRWKTVFEKKSGSTTLSTQTTFYAGNYEKITEGGITRQFYYLRGGILYVKQAGQPDKIYYTHKDHLGSIISITDDAGGFVFKATYDAWGKQNVITNNIGFHRGYTGHEHLPEIDIINMNGRMYDPIVGRFLAPDPYVFDDELSQDFNRYTYARNNPLIYTDPDGEFIWFVVAGAVIGGYIGGGLKSGNWNPVSTQFWNDGWQGVIVGGIVGAGLGALTAAGVAAGSGSVGYGATLKSTMFVPGGKTLAWSITSSALTTANLNMAVTGLMSGGDWDAMWKSGVSGLVSGALSGGVQNLVYQPDGKYVGFWKGFGIHGGIGGVTSLVDGALQGKTGLDLAEYAGWGALKSGLIGGVTDGLKSRIKGKSFWTGNDKIAGYQNGCPKYLHRDPLTLNKPDFKVGRIYSIEGKNRAFHFPVAFGMDFQNRFKSWNQYYRDIFTGKKEYSKVWFNFPILLPFIPFIEKY